MSHTARKLYGNNNSKTTRERTAGLVGSGDWFGVFLFMNACQNTDKEIWRKCPGDCYSPSMHVTAGGGIGINCGGHVIVAPVERWHDCGKKLILSDGWTPSYNDPDNGGLAPMAEAFCPKCEAESLRQEHAAQLEEDKRAESAERMASVQSLLWPNKADMPSGRE